MFSKRFKSFGLSLLKRAKFDFNSNNQKLNEDINKIRLETDINKISHTLKKEDISISVYKEKEDSEYLPELLKFYSTKIIDPSILDDIPHDVNIEGQDYKYGLPVKNQIFRVNSNIIEKERSANSYLSSTENLMYLLELDKDSSYESLVLKYNDYYNNEIDMYGNSVEAGLVENHEVFKYGVPIPTELLKNEKMMNAIRSYYRYNIDLPGNLEDVHPLKFVPDLRPIEDFKNTPIVPISEKEINQHKKLIEEKRRKLEIFEVDKKKIRFYGFAFVFGVILYKVFTYISYEAEMMNYEVEKIRLKRYRYRQEDFN